jgi:hypothetical protein
MLQTSVNLGRTASLPEKDQIYNAPRRKGGSWWINGISDENGEILMSKLPHEIHNIN